LHILDRIGRSKLAHLFISIFGDPDHARNQAIRAAAERIAARRAPGSTPLKLDFYDASSTEVWG